MCLIMFTYSKILESYLKNPIKYPRKYPKITAFFGLIMFCSSDRCRASSPLNAAINRIIFSLLVGVVVLTTSLSLTSTQTLATESVFYLLPKNTSLHGMMETLSPSCVFVCSSATPFHYVVDLATQPTYLYHIRLYKTYMEFLRFCNQRTHTLFSPQ